MVTSMAPTAVPFGPQRRIRSPVTGCLPASIVRMPGATHHDGLVQGAQLLEAQGRQPAEDSLAAFRVVVTTRLRIGQVVDD